MVMKLPTGAALLQLAVVVSGQTLIWQGRDTDLDNALNWDDASPFAASGLPLPQYVSFGTTGQTLKTVLPSSRTADMGSKLVFDGDGTIELGDGVGTASITFDSSAAAARTSIARFSPVPTVTTGTGAMRAAAFDWNCHLNWRVYSAPSILHIPLNPPCQGTIAKLPSDGKSYYADTYDVVSGATSVGLQGGTDTVSACQSSDQISIGSSVVNLRSCASKFTFGSGSQTCTSTCDSSQYTPVTLETGTFRVYWSGAYAGKAFQELYAGPGGSLSGLSEASSLVTVTGTIGSVDAMYMIGHRTVRGDGVLMTTVTTVTTVTMTSLTTNQLIVAAANAKGKNDGASGSTTIIVAIAVLAIVIVVAIVAYVVLKKQGQQRQKMERAGATSFENPMYDHEQMVAANAGSGLYSDPQMQGAGGAAGYMDVNPDMAGGSTGYMDVNPDVDMGGNTGYMDVDPSAEEGFGDGYMDVNPEDGGDGDDV